jgi:hypothetical protein
MASIGISAASYTPTVARGGGVRRDLVELLIGYLLVLIVLWTPRAWQRPFYIAAVVWIVAMTYRSWDGRQATGLRLTNLVRAAWILPAALGLAGVAVLISGKLGTLRVPPTPGLFIQTFWGYAIWSLAQQFLLQDFFLLRLLRLLPSTRAAVITAAGLFAFAHLPSPILTAVTFVWGIAASVHFLRYRNLYLLGLAHAICGICIAVAIPGPVTHNMRVGLGYVTYPHHRLHWAAQEPR